MIPPLTMKGIFYMCSVIVVSINVKADIVSCPASGQLFFPHPTSCSQFIECNDGESREIDCIEGFHFNPILGFCDLPENVGCEIENVQNEDTEETGSESDVEDSEENNSVDGDDGTSNDGEVDGDGDNDKDIDVEGGNGDNEEDNDVEKGNDDNNDEDSGIEDDGEGDNDGVGDNGIDNDDEGDEGACPATGQYFYPHPQFCSQFIECHNGLYTIVDCIDGLHFNPALGFCDFPANVACIDLEEDNDDSEGDYGIEDDSEGGEGACPATGQHFFPHPQFCSQFIECQNGLYTVVDCIDGLHFNSALGFCDFPDNVACTDLEEGSGDNEGDYGVEDDDEVGNGDGDDEGDVGDGSDVDSDGGEIEADNDKEGSGESTGETESNGDQEDSEGDEACPVTGQYFYPHPQICSQFIECHDGQYTIVDCFNGLYFNSALGFCDFPDNVDCIDSTESPVTTEIPKDNEDDEEDINNESSENSEIDEDDEGGPIGECPPENGQFVHFLTDSKDCGVFYKCDWGVPILFSCSGTLHFNPTLNVCDWPQYAGCTVG